MKKSLKDRIKELTTLDEIIEKDLTDPKFAAEYERASLRVAIARATKAAREESGLTQKEVADQLGVKQAQIGRLESTKDKSIPGIDFLASIATVIRKVIIIDHPTIRFMISPKNVAAKKTAKKPLRLVFAKGSAKKIQGRPRHVKT